MRTNQTRDDTWVISKEIDDLVLAMLNNFVSLVHTVPNILLYHTVTFFAVAIFFPCRPIYISSMH